MAPHTHFSRHRPSPVLARLVALLTLAAASGAAHAGITFKLDRAHASPGETVTVQGLYFNDGNAAAAWQVPAELILQWRAADGGVVRSLAYLDVAPGNVNIPVNNFAQMAWKAVVPAQVAGLQAVAVEGDGAMMALDTSAREVAPVAGRPANVPVIDAGRPQQGPGTGAPLPPAALADAPTTAPDTEIAARQGPAPVQVSQSAFDRFRSGLSAYEPVYFDFGSRGGANARFQISLKYRLFTPDDPAKPSFTDNLYLAYTQTALWDLAGDSKPFVDTTYNPSLFWLSEKAWESPRRNWYLGFSGGVAHASNGKGGDDSRSVNNAFVEPAVNYRFDSGSTLSFAPRFKRYFALGSENRDYADYAGYVDWKLRWAQDNGLVLTALYRQGDAGRRGTQLEAAWPLKRTFLNMNGYLHLQYFNGYGETLLGYNQRNESQFRIGLSLVP